MDNYTYIDPDIVLDRLSESVRQVLLGPPVPRPQPRSERRFAVVDQRLRDAHDADTNRIRQATYRHQRNAFFRVYAEIDLWVPKIGDRPHIRGGTMQQIMTACGWVTSYEKGCREALQIMDTSGLWLVVPQSDWGARALTMQGLRVIRLDSAGHGIACDVAETEDEKLWADYEKAVREVRACQRGAKHQKEMERAVDFLEQVEVRARRQLGKNGIRRGRGG